MNTKKNLVLSIILKEVYMECYVNKIRVITQGLSLNVERGNDQCGKTP